MKQIHQRPYRRKQISHTQVQELAASGIQLKAMASLIGVSALTFKKRLREDELINHAYNRGRSEYAEKHGKQTVITSGGNLKAVESRFAEANDIRENPEYAIFHFIRMNPGATFSDIKRGLGCLTEDKISDHLAVLSLEKGKIEIKQRPGNYERAYYPFPFSRRVPPRSYVAA